MVVTGSASTQSFGAYQSMFQSAGPGVTSLVYALTGLPTRCPKFNLAGREWMIVTNGSPSGTPGNNPDPNSEPASYLIQEHLVLCRLTKSQDNASVPNSDKGPLICMHHRYLMALKSKFAVGLSRLALDRCNSARKSLESAFRGSDIVLL
ncbi:hypothetical protein ASPTUDRAFT_931812 [Aspergillus tubingensis CBS 134.48]|uniref:Uncharacterized protein n=1 Tax=Aspergillus tubingensis (strain CBS 134.48) TaxID=767770 RepID=A0A1L9N1Y1_ASPTC|nr:hypothetical protein ASPTUDRAFT_931812 [Aspergillus tubingensis CBS 134.48]